MYRRAYPRARVSDSRALYRSRRARRSAVRPNRSQLQSCQRVRSLVVGARHATVHSPFTAGGMSVCAWLRSHHRRRVSCGRSHARRSGPCNPRPAGSEHQTRRARASGSTDRRPRGRPPDDGRRLRINRADTARVGAAALDVGRHPPLQDKCVREGRQYILGNMEPAKPGVFRRFRCANLRR